MQTKVEKTPHDRDRTDRISLTHMTLTFNPLRAMVMTYQRAKGQGQRSFGSEDRVETNGRTVRRTEAIALPPSLTQSVKIDKFGFKVAFSGHT